MKHFKRSLVRKISVVLGPPYIQLFSQGLYYFQVSIFIFLLLTISLVTIMFLDFYALAILASFVFARIISNSLKGFRKEIVNILESGIASWTEKFELRLVEFHLHFMLLSEAERWLIPAFNRSWGLKGTYHKNKGLWCLKEVIMGLQGREKWFSKQMDKQLHQLETFRKRNSKPPITTHLTSPPSNPDACWCSSGWLYL